MSKKTKFITKEYKLEDLLYFYLFTFNFYFEEVKLFSEDIPKSDKEGEYQKLKPKLEELKEIFREIVAQRNKIATLRGYSNYLELFLRKNEIPKSKYNFFLEKVDKLISEIHKDLPEDELRKKVKNWDIFNIPFPHAKLVFPEPFGEPRAILTGISEYSSRFKKYRREKKIRFRFWEDESTSLARYLPKENVVEIKLAKDLGRSTDRILVVVHEIGHALVLLDKQKNKSKKTNKSNRMPRYYMEFEANKFTYNFVKKTMSNKAQKIIKYNLLEIIAMSLFEIDIYSNPSQDFDQVFAKTVNRCYLKAKQTKNPFYALGKNLVLSPLENLLHGISYLELYLKEAERANRN